MPRKKKPNPLPRGVPPKEIDWNKVDQYLIGGSNGVQIAGKFGIHPDTLYDRCQQEKGVVFSAYAQEKRSCGDADLHLSQYLKAVKDKNTTMLIHLGKHRLGQKDHDDKDIPPNDNNLTSLLEEIKTLKEKVNAT